MPHPILGSGLVSPCGLTPREHAFYLPALLPPPASSPFVGPKGKPVAIERCAWLGAAAPIAGRLAALAIQSARTALADVPVERTIGLLFCSEQARPGLTDDDVRDALEALSRVVRPVFTQHLRGGGAPFGAIDAAMERVARDGVDALLVIAVDSMISLEAVTRYVVGAPGHWMGWPPLPSEGGAALLLASKETARRWAVRPIATLQAATAQPGTSRDDDDEIVDGVALTAAMRRVAGARVHYAFGPVGVAGVRQREWQLAMGRNCERFRAGHDEIDLESHVGGLGMAAGLANLVYGIAALRHHTLPGAWPRDEAFLAWHITRDGVRGIASVRAGDVS